MMGKYDKEFFLRPVCRVEAGSDAEATDKVLDALGAAGIEVRGWK